jgi:polysaccharide deacetylase 2 family uncharacterized protein YibQ
VSTPRPNRHKQKQGGGKYAALAILALIILAVTVYLLFSPRKQVTRTPAPPPPPVVQRHVLPTHTPTPTVPPVVHKTPKPVLKLPLPAETPSPVILPPAATTTDTGKGRGRLAIVIDDMGTTVQEARSLTAIGVPLTFSIIPGLRNYREVAAYAAASGIETMIHIPMQPKGWPQRRLEVNGLLVSMEDADIREHLQGFLRDIPKAVGANNHMGSEFTEHGDKMLPVLELLKGRGLFFIDSVTSPKSVGQKLARELGMKSGRRNVFLDNEQDPVYIRGQINQAVRLAKKSGTAIAICHPHPVTIKTLSAMLPDLERQGITLVPVSRLVR